MAEGSATASATAVTNKRKSTGNGGTGSRATTPTSATEGVSKKRARSETPSDPAASNDENQNSSNANPGFKKKKKTGTGANSAVESSSSSSTQTFEEEIAAASSQATIRLLTSSLDRLTEGIPKRELRLIVSEAKVCEASLEEEIRILKEGLKLEQQRKQQKATTKTEPASDNVDEKTVAKKASSDSASTIHADTADSPEGPKKEDGAEKSKEDSSSTTATSTAETPKESTTLEKMLGSEFTPPDTHWTLSALLGRLRHELTTPLPPRSQLPTHREKSGLTQLALNVGLTSQTTYKKRGPKPGPQAAAAVAAAVAAATGSATAAAKNNSGAATVGKEAASTTPTKAEAGASSTTQKTPSEASNTSTATSASPATTSLLNEPSQFKRLGTLPDFPEYTKEHVVPDKLLAIWKKLTTHRSSLVFRRPVNPKEAPGYTDRIRFPMDLSLIRKLIVSKHIQTYEGILKQVHLIGHNCVKYNGRESDYALVTREFESVATEYVWNAVMRETYGGRGRWSRNVSPMPPTAAASSMTSPPSSVPFKAETKPPPAASAATTDASANSETKAQTNTAGTSGTEGAADKP